MSIQIPQRHLVTNAVYPCHFSPKSHSGWGSGAQSRWRARQRGVVQVVTEKPPRPSFAGYPSGRMMADGTGITVQIEQGSKGCIVSIHQQDLIRSVPSGV